MTEARLGNWRERLQRALQLEPALLVSAGPVQGGSSTGGGASRRPGVLVANGTGIIGAAVASTPILGRLLVCWCANSDSVVVNMSAVHAR